MKWWDKPLGPGDVSQHLVRLYHRDQAGGIFITNSQFTAAALKIYREALQQRVVIICQLEELVQLLNLERDLLGFLKEKIQVAIADQNPHYEPLRNNF